MRRSYHEGLLILGFLALGACGGDATAPKPSPIAGTYALATVNGQPLPAFAFELQPGPRRWEITGGTLEMYDRTYWRELVWQVTSPWSTGEQVTGGRGTYTMNGATISFEEGFTGTATGGSLTVALDGRTLVFRR